LPQKIAGLTNWNVGSGFCFWRRRIFSEPFIDRVEEVAFEVFEIVVAVDEFDRLLLQNWLEDLNHLTIGLVAFVFSEVGIIEGENGRLKFEEKFIEENCDVGVVEFSHWSGEGFEFFEAAEMFETILKVCESEVAADVC